MKRIKLLAIILGLSLFFVPILYAGGFTVMGRITHENGKPAVKVIVSVSDKFTYTDIKGRYRIKGVLTGNQTLTVKKGDSVLKEVSIDINKPLMRVNAVIP